MSEMLTLKLKPKTVSKLRRLAAKGGESLEELVQRLLEQLASVRPSETEAQLSDKQLDDLRRRAKNPGPFATPKEVAAVLSKFKV